MKKMVNGVVVEISNDVIDLFEKALEGSVTKRMLANKVDTAFDSDIDEVRNVVYEYYKTYSKMPYPLYVIEDDIKYAVIARAVGRNLKNSIGYVPSMEVEDGLVTVYLRTGYCVQLASDTWKIEHYEYADAENDAEIVDLADYSDSGMYRFFEWFDINSAGGKTPKGFYSYAVPGLLEACGGKSLVVKWEIAKLLQFGEVPNSVHVEDRCIRNIDSNDTYKVDIFWDGEYSNEGAGKVLVIDLREGGKTTAVENKKKVYKFDVYKHSKESGRAKLTSSKKAFENVFNAVLDSVGEADADEVKFHGMMSGKHMAIEIGKSIYVGIVGKELVAIGNGVKLISMNGSKVYLAKSVNKRMGAQRNAEYAYDIETDTLKICNVAYDKAAARA